MCLLNLLSAPFIRTVILIFTLSLMGSNSPAHSQTGARFISNQQWEAEVQITFNPEVRDREPKIDRILADQLLEKLKAQRITYDLRKQIGQNGGLTYGIQLMGIEGWGQFRKALFLVTNPTTLLTDGPVLLELTGTVKPGEPLALTLESNLASGYSWEMQPMDTLKLEPGGAMRFQPAGRGLGVSTRQIVFLKGLAGGETALRILYRRPWIKSEVPEMEITLRAGEISLISDLSNPDPSFSLAPPLAPAADRATGAPIVEFPAAFDWRGSGIVPPVRDQGNCGSCWAFGTVGPLEANLGWKGVLNEDLSEEFLLSCNTSGYGCNGGWWAHEYHFNKLVANQSQPGAVLEAVFPYVAAKQPCVNSYSHPHRITGWSYVGDDSSIPSEEAIKNAIYTYGPVAVAVCAGPAMQRYEGGIFDTEERYYCGGDEVNHGVVLVGWDDGEHTWIMRNSWGGSWGESGYMRITRGISNIGYAANYVIYSLPFIPSHWIFLPLVLP